MLSRWLEHLSRLGKSMIDLTPFKTDLENICQELSLQQLDLIGSAARDDFS